MQELESLTWLYNNIYPLFFYGWVFILAILIQFTFSGHVEKTGDKNVYHLIIITLRKRILVFYLLLTAFSFICVYGAAWKAFDDNFDKANDYLSLLLKKIPLDNFSSGDISGLLFFIFTPYLITFIHRRYIKPKLSSLIRKYRVSQTSDTMSDIRIENQKHQPKIFDPRDHYKDGYFFLGMDDKNKPIYKPDNYIAKVNIKILGATQTGKGVTQGVIIDQSIKKGWGTWFFDQKPDDFIYSIMHQACLLSKINPPVVFDINNYRGVSYEPFLNGTKRERLSRLFKAFEIESGGTDADFYKRKSRMIIDLIYNKWNGTILDLGKLTSGNDLRISDDDNETIKKYGDAIKEKVSEWCSLDSIGSKGKNLLNIPESIKNADIVYILGSTSDKLVKAINKCILSEWVSSIKNIKPEKHIYAAIDEVRFVISSEVADSLAVILSKNANMSIAYQERDDLLNIDNEKTTISLSIKKGSETNTNLTFIYQCGDETAEWIAKNSGTIAKSLTKLEEVDTDGFGAENWKGRRMIGQQEEHFIPVNTILSLPPRVAVMQTIDDLSKIIYSSWIPLDKGFNELPAVIVNTLLNNPVPSTKPQPEYQDSFIDNEVPPFPDFNPMDMSEDELRQLENRMSINDEQEERLERPVFNFGGASERNKNV